MKQRIGSLKKRVMIYVIIAVVLFSLIVVVSTFMMQQKRVQQKQGEFNAYVDAISQQILNSHVKRYIYLSRRMIETEDIAKYLKEKNRDALSKLFHKKWELLQEEEPNLEIMQIHFADGSSFLRMHERNVFGDQLEELRPMVKEIDQKHKLIYGYETGKYGTDFRILSPIFDKDGSFIGSLELGLNPAFVLTEVVEMTDFSGMMFVENAAMKLFSKPSEVIIEGYKLQSQSPAKLSKVYDAFIKLNKLQTKMQFEADGHRYVTHLFVLNDFKNQAKVKIVFFQDITNNGIMRSYLLLILLALLLIISSILLWIIYNVMNVYEQNIENIYDNQMKNLQESENRFRLLYERAPDAYQSLDKDGNIIVVNHKWLQELGYTEEEVVGRNISEFLTPEFQVLFKKYFPLFQKEGKIQNLEFDMVRKDGEIIHASFNGQIAYDEQKDFLQTHCIFTNVTEKKNLHNMLELERKYLEATFENNPNIIITTDGKKIDKANKAMLEFFGYESLTAFRNEHECICDFFLEDEDCLYRSVSGVDWLSYILKHEDETHYVCMQKGDKEHVFFIRAHELGLSDTQRRVVVFNDITELRELEEKLQESKKLFDYFMNNIPYLVIIKNENLEVVYANKMADDFSKKIENGLIEKQNLESDVAQKLTLLEKEAQKKGKAEGVIEVHNGNKLYIFRSLSFTLPQEDGSVYSATVSMDITEQKQMADKLKEQEELMLAQSRHAAMGEMISMIAHQWRQPLSVISMGANNILMDVALGSINEKSLEMEANSILLQTQHLSKTIDDFRDFFKPNKNKEKVLVSSVFNEALSVIGKSFENHNIIVQNIYDSSTKVEIYARELLQVLLNILKNAKEALQEAEIKERKITNTIYENKKNVVIEICNNGSSIKDDIIAKIFDPYFSTKDEKNGTGLGLYMSKIIVEKHLHGTISVVNRVNCVCFTITIPKAGEGVFDD